MLLARRLTAPGVVRSAQYVVFDRFAPSVLLNFNNDNLAEVVHRKHLRLRPHGAIDAAFVHASIVDEAIWYLGTVPESWIKRLTYHRPLPEPADITSREEYRLLPHCWEALNAVVVIGYSFGEQRQSGLIHDAESFDLIVDLLRWRPKPVWSLGRSQMRWRRVLRRVFGGACRYLPANGTCWHSSFATGLLSALAPAHGVEARERLHRDTRLTKNE